MAKAAPSPAPTTAVPTISVGAHDRRVFDVGEFDYEGRTLYCVEAEGEIHNVLRVEGGHSTCRHTDEQLPRRLDIWVPRSYAHALAVLEATDWRDVSWLLVGVYRDEHGRLVRRLR